ncbi:hypothetical protein [Pseudonocardia spinosispora]|nr:hypothetical protein [Pseudonocardia spinosispora]
MAESEKNRLDYLHRLRALRDRVGWESQNDRIDVQNQIDRLEAKRSPT